MAAPRWAKYNARSTCGPFNAGARSPVLAVFHVRRRWALQFLPVLRFVETDQRRLSGFDHRPLNRARLRQHDDNCALFIGDARLHGGRQQPPGRAAAVEHGLPAEGLAPALELRRLGWRLLEIDKFVSELARVEPRPCRFDRVAVDDAVDLHGTSLYSDLSSFDKLRTNGDGSIQR